MFSFLKKNMPLHFMIAFAIIFLMALTRGSHVLTHVSLPDASLALFLMGGLYLRKAIWFLIFATLATMIDFGAAAVDSLQAFCLTDGYWGMLPTYLVMWLAGFWLGKQELGKPALAKQVSGQKALLEDFTKFMFVGLMATFFAFVISTQTYYLFSGRFPNQGIFEALKHGWEYLPSYLGFTLAYLFVFWSVAKVVANLNMSDKLNHAKISKGA